jgi:uncharacterized membrane protein (UPF0127 family)
MRMTKTTLVVNVTRGNALCVGELADRPVKRMRGLIGRTGLPSGEGILLRPAPAIHTAFMRFPIDALFLDRGMNVVAIVEQLQPWRVAGRRGAHSVLEMAAGECSRCGVELGDELALRDRSPVAPEDAAPPPAPSAGAGTTTAPEGEGQVARIRPLRVLVVSDDGQFRRVSSLLLSRRRVAVFATASPGRASEQVLRDGADVVVVDMTHQDAERCVESIDALARPVGIVLVARKAHVDANGRRVLAKWDAFSRIVTAIERADVRRGSWG